jgi:hypothetical protein
MLGSLRGGDVDGHRAAPVVNQVQPLVVGLGPLRVGQLPCLARYGAAAGKGMAGNSGGCARFRRRWPVSPIE